jgi:hypothetical protein
MAAEAHNKLFEALKAHTSDLETERDGAPEHDRVILDRRVEATRRLLEWLSMTLACPRELSPAETRTPQ